MPHLAYFILDLINGWDYQISKPLLLFSHIQIPPTDYIGLILRYTAVATASSVPLRVL